MPKTDDLGYLKRVDRPNGWSNLVDGFGRVIASIRTDTFPPESKNMRRSRYRISTYD